MFYQNTMDRKKVAEILKEAMLKEYGSVAEYARLTGQEYKKVHSWTCGKRLPEVEDIVATCNILKLPLEYALVGTNRNFSESENENAEDEYEAMARYTYPNLLFADAALLFPLIGMQAMMDIIYRVGDSGDSFYIYNLLQRHIQTDTAAWKYYVYILQQRNSPLVDKLPKMNADITKMMEWDEAYRKKKDEFFNAYRTVRQALYLLTELNNSKKQQ